MKNTHIAILQLVTLSFLILTFLSCSSFNNIPSEEEGRPEEELIDTCYIEIPYIRSGIPRTKKVYYNCGEVIVDPHHNNYKAWIKYLRKEDFEPIDNCDCNPDLQLWKANPEIRVNGLVKSSPPEGDGVGGLSLNFKVEFPTPSKIGSANRPNYPALNIDCESSNIVKVAVLDTGIDPGNKILDDFYWKQVSLNESCPPGFIPNTFGIDILNPRLEPFDWHGHGTHIQGILSGVASPKLQYRPRRSRVDCRFSPRLCQPIEFLHGKFSKEKTSTGNLFDLLCAAYYAIDQGAKIINISCGFLGLKKDTEDFPPFKSFLDYAAEQQVLIVASMGNDTLNLEEDIGFFPASYASDYPNLISVGAFDSNHHFTQNGNLAPFSNWVKDSDEMTIVAWGVNVPSTASNRRKSSRMLYPDYPYTIHRKIESQTGSSMSAPFASLTAAIMLSINPDLTPAVIKDIIAKTATEKDGIRILNFEKSLNFVCKKSP